MAQQEPLTDRILEQVRGSPDVGFEILVSRCPEFSCGEVFHEVARLSRMGEVRVTRGAGLFSIRPQVPVRPAKTAVRRRTQPRKSMASPRSDR
jgi:hypothetical protein